MSGPSSSAPPNRTTDEHAGNARAGLGASKDALRTSVGALARADSSTGENVLRRLSLDTASVHNPTNPGAANGSALPPSPGGSLSPNHPDNLRKQARATLDSGFSVKSYVGAANTLLEKAEAADRQGQLENAFVNYLKAAG